MEHRAQFRVGIEETGLLEVFLKAADGAPLPVEPIDLSIGGCSVRLSVAPVEPTSAAVGDAIEVIFRSVVIDRPLQFSARVVDVSEGEGPQRLGLAFTDRTQLARLVTVDLYRMFNRRFEARTPCAEHVVVELALAGREQGMLVQGTMTDVSPSGMGVNVPAAAETSLLVGDDITVAVTLPSGERVAPLHGTIVSMDPSGSHTRFGICFDRAAHVVEHPGEQRERVNDVVGRVAALRRNR